MGAKGEEMSILIGDCDFECLHEQLCEQHPNPLACSQYHLMRQQARSVAASEKGQKTLER